MYCKLLKYKDGNTKKNCRQLVINNYYTAALISKNYSIFSYDHSEKVYNQIVAFHTLNRFTRVSGAVSIYIMYSWTLCTCPHLYMYIVALSTTGGT